MLSHCFAKSLSSLAWLTTKASLVSRLSLCLLTRFYTPVLTPHSNQNNCYENINCIRPSLPRCHQLLQGPQSPTCSGLAHLPSLTSSHLSFPHSRLFWILQQGILFSWVFANTVPSSRMTCVTPLYPESHLGRKVRKRSATLGKSLLLIAQFPFPRVILDPP